MLITGRQRLQMNDHEQVFWPCGWCDLGDFAGMGRLVHVIPLLHNRPDLPCISFHSE